MHCRLGGVRLLAGALWAGMGPLCSVAHFKFYLTYPGSVDLSTRGAVAFYS